MKIKAQTKNGHQKELSPLSVFFFCWHCTWLLSLYQYLSLTDPEICFVSAYSVPLQFLLSSGYTFGCTESSPASIPLQILIICRTPKVQTAQSSRKTKLLKITPKRDRFKPVPLILSSPVLYFQKQFRESLSPLQQVHSFPHHQRIRTPLHSDYIVPTTIGKWLLPV